VCPSALPGMTHSQVPHMHRRLCSQVSQNRHQLVVRCMASLGTSTTPSLVHADQRVERTTAAFEKAAVLFNLAAALSADAAAADLTSDAGCKRAARRYQVPHITLCSWLI
jgi:BRO1-like domain